MKGTQHGYILNSDMTITYTAQSGKTPIGVVVCSYPEGGGQAMALESIGEYKWGISIGYDIPNLSNSFGDFLEAALDIASCANSAKIMAAGDKSKYPAAWAAHEYKTEGTSAGDWCLPAAGIFTSYYNNRDAINSGFTKVGGTQFFLNAYGTYAWSSTEDDTQEAWSSGFGNNFSVIYTYKYYGREVRPVLEF